MKNFNKCNKSEIYKLLKINVLIFSNVNVLLMCLTIVINSNKQSTFEHLLTTKNKYYGTLQSNQRKTKF